jgi:hypothetical protein
MAATMSVIHGHHRRGRGRDGAPDGVDPVSDMGEERVSSVIVVR